MPISCCMTFVVIAILRPATGPRRGATARTARPGRHRPPRRSWVRWPPADSSSWREGDALRPGTERLVQLRTLGVSRGISWPCGVGRFPTAFAGPPSAMIVGNIAGKSAGRPAAEELPCSKPPSPAACPSLPGSPRPTSSGRRGRRGRRLERAKADATLLWLKVQEDAGIDIVGDGEQSRQHFVHGFLAQVEGIDFAHKVEMGIRDNRYEAMVPQVVGPLRLAGRVHASEARLARAHTTRKLEVHLARADDDRRHRRRPLLRRQGEDGASRSPNCSTRKRARSRPTASTSSSSTSPRSTST